MDFKRIEGERTIQQDLAAANPYYPQPGYTGNCGNCAVAYELRRKGYDVEARTAANMYLGDFADMFDGANIQRSSALSVTEDAREMAEKIEQDILTWGDGARGAIRGDWTSTGRGHFFSVEVNAGEVIFVDGQVGKYNVRYLERMKPQNIDYVRLDNTMPNDKTKNAVQNRRAV